MSVPHGILALIARGERYGYELRGELAEEFGAVSEIVAEIG